MADFVQPQPQPLQPPSPYDADMAAWEKISGPFKQARAALEAKLGKQQTMYSPEEMAQRRGANQQEYDLGMLASLSSDEALRNVGGALFKNALAARQPKVTEHGVADPITGQWNYNPGYLDEKTQAQITAMDTKEAAQRQSFIEGRQRARESYERHMADITARREAAGAAAGLRNDAAEGRRLQGNYRLEDQMRGDFDKMTKDLREGIQATQTIKSVIGAYSGQKPDPIAQQSIVILLNKFLDPGSVVREGEFDRTAKGQGLIARAQLLVPRLARGDILTDDTIRQIQELAQVYEDAANRKGRYIAGNYSDIATRRGLDVGSIISDPTWRGGASAQPKPTPAAPTGPTPAQQAINAEIAKTQAALEAARRGQGALPQSIMRQPQAPQGAPGMPGGLPLFTMGQR